MPEPSTPQKQKRRIVYRIHAVQRMVERGIGESDVEEIIAEGKVIEAYPNDCPYPSKLVLGWMERRPIHVVFAESACEIIVITVYEADATLWEGGFERRKP